MAKCSMCDAANKKLYKGDYLDFRVYVCKVCLVNYEIELKESA